MTQTSTLDRQDDRHALVLSDRGMDCTADPRINAAPVSVRLRAGCWRKTPYLAALARRRARPRPPSQRWRTFLSNHRADIAAQRHSRSQETLPLCQKFPHHFRSTVPRVNPRAPNPRARARGRGADDGAGGAARARRWCATAPRFNNCVEGRPKLHRSPPTGIVPFPFWGGLFGTCLWVAPIGAGDGGQQAAPAGRSDRGSLG